MTKFKVSLTLIVDAEDESSALQEFWDDITLGQYGSDDIDIEEVEKY